MCSWTVPCSTVDVGDAVSRHEDVINVQGVPWDWKEVVKVSMITIGRGLVGTSWQGSVKMRTLRGLKLCVV